LREARVGFIFDRPLSDVFRSGRRSQSAQVGAKKARRLLDIPLDFNAWKSVSVGHKWQQGRAFEAI
jgi:hypothetical protein